MTFNTKTHQYGFCDNISNCACFAAYISESRKGCDMSHVIDKRVETWLEKYGVENISQSATVQKKRSSTIKSRNYDNLYNRLSYDKQSQGFEQVVTRLATHVTPMFTRDSYIGSSRKNFYSWKCIICNNQFDDHVDYGRIPRCKTCYPHNKSKGELELQNYLDSLQIKYTCNDRSILGDLEYDIYIPEKKIAIEFNGVYWHSTEFKDSDYHVNKFLRSAEEGIHLISIFEDEWINKKEIVCSRLASVLGCSKTIPARKCKIVELSGKDYRQFVQQNSASTIGSWVSANAFIRRSATFPSSAWPRSFAARSLQPGADRWWITPTRAHPGLPGPGHNGWQNRAPKPAHAPAPNTSPDRLGNR